MSSSDDQSPVLIELDEDAAKQNPAEAPMIVSDDAPTGQAMQVATAFAARPQTMLGRWFWRFLVATLAFFISLAAWDAITGLIARNSVVGWAAVALLAGFALICTAISIRELSALIRLNRVEKLQNEAAGVLTNNDVEGARAFVRRLIGFYTGRTDTAWGRKRLSEQTNDIFDAETGLAQAEDALLVPLDQAAMREVEAAARQVATVTALIPLAFADILVALTTNLRMIRRIADVYGGRSGTLGAWRLTRAVAAHLVATGAVAVGDDLIGSVGGGHLLGKLSRRFGEGIVNGALTARVGIAAMEVCRPMPFINAPKPRVTTLVGRALTGLFDKEA